MDHTSSRATDLTILEHIEQNPDSSQALLARQLGVAIGTINWHIKRLVDKGYIKLLRAERRKLRYIITPDGMALRAHLTLEYIQSGFHLYRLVRARMSEALEQVRQAGHHSIRLAGSDGEVAEICRLTCLEEGMTIVEDNLAPLLRIDRLKIFIEE